MASPPLPRRQVEPHSPGFTLAAIALLVLMLGLGGASALSSLAMRLQRPAADDGATISRELLGRHLTIPTAWMVGPTGGGGFASRVDLQLDLPLGKNGAPVPIRATLLPLSLARPSAELLDGVYLHEFMPNELSGPPGLVGKPLYANEGYENETVWYDALSQAPFVAKCMAPVVDSGEGDCLRTVALPGGIAAVYRFGSGALYAWRDFDRVAGVALKRIGAVQ